MRTRTGLRRTGGMLAIASICGVLPGPAHGSTPRESAASRVTSGMSISAAGWRSVASIDSAPALASKVARGVTYGGSTSGDDPVVIVLSRHGTQVKRTHTQFAADCNSGNVLPFFVEASASLAISESGRFAGVRSSEEYFADDTTARETVTLKGKVKGKKMSGSLRLHADIVDATGAAVDACDQTATFTAMSARGKVFGGHTSQHGPVVVEIAANATAVHHFHIGWESSCTPSWADEPTGSFLVTGDTLRNFPITRDRFGDDFAQNSTQPNGARETLNYSLRGKIKRGRVTGTFGVKSAVADATGTTLATCDTGNVSYAASSG